MQKVKSLLEKFVKKAGGVLVSKNKTLRLIETVIMVAGKNKASLGGIKENLMLLVNVVTDIIKGNYKGFSKKSALLIVGGLLYLVSPLDVIPDFIFGLGFLDDIYVVNLIFQRIGKELSTYRTWKDQQMKIVHI
jgi:uncharacterized membrane protein YkvA (DUF1232 family)